MKISIGIHKIPAAYPKVEPFEVLMEYKVNNPHEIKKQLRDTKRIFQLLFC
jgi:hypothetical protein